MRQNRNAGLLFPSACPSANATSWHRTDGRQQNVRPRRPNIRFIFKNNARRVTPREIRRYQHIKSIHGCEFILNNAMPCGGGEKQILAASDPKEHHGDGTRNQEALVLLTLAVALFTLPSGKEKKHVAVWWPSPVWNAAAPLNTTRTSHSDRDSLEKRGVARNSCPQTAPSEHVARHIVPLIRFTMFLNAPPC